MDRQTNYSGTPLSGHPSSADTHDIMDNSERPTVLPFISILKQPLNSGSTGSTICQARPIIVQCGVRISVLSVAFRDVTKAAHVGDHEVEMSQMQRTVVLLADVDVERRRRLTRVQVWQHC